MAWLWDSFVDALVDSVKLLPFLFVIYLIIEYLEHKTGEKMKATIQKADKLGPLFGGLLGIVPQCGFSTAAATLYTERLITTGTLLAVFLSTSDEMLPLLLTEAVDPGTIFKILGMKLGISVATGYGVDLILRYLFRQKHEDVTIHTEKHQHEMNLFLASLLHSLEVFVYLLVFSFVINLCIYFVGEDVLAAALTGRPIVSVLLSAFVGLIPNCASSVLITKLYLSGLLGTGALFAGLLVNAGVGTLVLLRTSESRKRVLLVVGALFIAGLFWGLALTLAGVQI